MPSRYVGEMGVFLFAGVSERLELNNFVCVCVCVCVCVVMEKSEADLSSEGG
jgi:hypothetical protein